jgi:hypothetical protein
MKDTYDLNDDAPRYVIEALIPVDRPLSSDDLADNYDPPKPNNLAELSNEYRDESGAVGRIGVEKDRSPQNLRMPTGIREHGRKPHQIREELDLATSPSSSAMGEGVPTARSRAGEESTMGDQDDGAAHQFYVLARLETYDDVWNSLHLTYEDDERQLKAVAVAWGVGFTPGRRTRRRVPVLRLRGSPSARTRRVRPTSGGVVVRGLAPRRGRAHLDLAG